MKILFDHNVPKKLRRSLKGHDVRTAEEMEWQELENGKLLAAAEAAEFQLMITCDQSMSYQQNLRDRKLALLLLGTTNWSVLQTALERITEAVEHGAPGTFQRVDPT